ncbi:MAG: nucleoside triphosphate pyrophosphohydrolase [Ruminococcus sp.]|jgi:tetrapyrrole methylase family protein/MazG family protein|nr:nucleoside triphosphate pyrophosphohydrolase [Ruminococcus sp.]
MNFAFKSRYNIGDLLEIVSLLRSENGCPWDKIQTHKTIRNDLLEECYEAVEAIDTDNPVLLREELGDVLLQVVFHSSLEEDAKRFDFDDVANDICVKLINRHPHVFGNVTADTPEEVLKNWDSIKRAEKSQKSAVETLEAVSPALPALMRAEKVFKRVNRAGLSRDKDIIIDNIDELFDELSDITSTKDTNLGENEAIIGEILLNICELCVFYKIFPEQLLTEALKRFIIDFGQVGKDNPENLT